MEKFFKLKENGTDVRTEVTAGVTTFLAMVYILAVNPNILSASGMNSAAVFTATAVSAGFATLIMAFYANYPVALASGMGLNAYFAFSVCVPMAKAGIQDPWKIALAAVLCEGIIFILLSLTQFREKLVNDIPMNLKYGITSGIGLFIVIVGLKGAGIVIGDQSTLVTMGKVGSPEFVLAMIGLIIIAVLHHYRVKGDILIGILATWILGIIAQGAGWYKVDIDAGVYSLIPSFAGGFLPAKMNLFAFDFDWIGAHVMDFVVIVFSFLPACRGTHQRNEGAAPVSPLQHFPSTGHGSQLVDDRLGVRLGWRADWLRPREVVGAVRVELGLKRKACARQVGLAAFGVGIIEPVSRVEVRARRAHAYLKRAATSGVKGGEGQARWGTRLPAPDAEAVIVSARSVELLVVPVDVAPHRLWLAKVEGRAVDGTYLARRDRVLADGEKLVCLEAHDRSHCGASVVACQVEVAVVGHVHKGEGIGLAGVRDREARGLIRKVDKRDLAGEGTVAGQSKLALAKLAGKAHRVSLLDCGCPPHALVEPRGKAGVEVVALAGSIVSRKVAGDGGAYGHLCPVRAVCDGPYGGAMAGGVVEVVLERCQAEKNVPLRSRGVGDLQREERCPKLHEPEACPGGGDREDADQISRWRATKGLRADHGVSSRVR